MNLLTFRPLLVLALFSFTLALPTIAMSMSWERAIESVKKREAELYEKAEELRTEDTGHLGSIYGTYNMQEHRCSILGRMLGKTEAIRHLEEEPFEGSDDAYEYLIEANNLGNWVYAAERLIKRSKAWKVRTWNFECAGKLEIPSSEWIEDKHADAFFVVHDDILQILGPVTIGYSARLETALNQNQQVTTVALGSGGGNVIEAFKAGIIIRKRRLDTTLWDQCYSACPLVFLGGVERFTSSPYQEFGFHQISNEAGDPAPFNDPIYQKVAQYIDLMGATSKQIVSWMWSEPPSQMMTLDYDDRLCEVGLTTWIQRGCSR